MTEHHESDLARLDDFHTMGTSNLDQTFQRESERLLAETLRRRPSNPSVGATNGIRW